MSQSSSPAHGYRWYPAVVAVFVTCLITANIIAVKPVEVGGLIFPAAVVIFPLAYIFGDILTEVYGYRRSRSVIWLGFFSALLMSVTFIVVGKLPPAADWNGQAAYDQILGLTPRIVIASLIAYFSGEFSNSYILAKMKIWTGGRWLWTRTIGSTIVGELVDTALFVTIAFYGVIPNSLLIAVLVSNYVFKTGVEVLFTPITYRMVRFLKRAEQEDYYDRDTNFNPFVTAK